MCQCIVRLSEVEAQCANVPMCQRTNVQMGRCADVQMRRLPIHRPTDPPTYRSTDLPIHRPTDLPTYRSTDLPTHPPEKFNKESKLIKRRAGRPTEPPITQCADVPIVYYCSPFTVHCSRPHMARALILL